MTDGLHSALVVSGCHKRASASNDSNDSNESSGRPRQAAMAAATHRLRAGYAQATRVLGSRRLFVWYASTLELPRVASR
jgi:hypothetical protein